MPTNPVKISTSFTQIMRAFDKGDNGLLLQKLHTIGIRGRLLKSMQSCLIGTSQRIRIRGCFSDEKQVSGGAPQGSIVASGRK